MSVPVSRCRFGKIIIDNMTVHGIVGAKPRERDKQQALHVTITLWTDFLESSETDDLKHTVDYSTLSKKVYEFITEKKAYLLEHLVESVAQYVFSLDKRIIKLKVLIRKPSAILLADSASVMIKRHRNDYPHLVNQEAVGISSPDLPSEGLEEVYIALGSNLGDRAKNIELALEKLKLISYLKQVSFLYETNPKYDINQPKFLNCACKVTTKLEPPQLLNELKRIEDELVRDRSTIRNGPRVIDLDILFYGSRRILLSTLVVPHPQLQERDFVVGPMMDIAPNFVHPVLTKTIYQLWKSLDECRGVVSVCPVTLMGKGIVLPFHNNNKTLLMGILNATPDSFSDGGDYPPDEIDKILKHVKHMVDNSNMDILDIGGESTRPGATPVTAQEEKNRIIPIIKALRSQAWFNHVLISVDTYKSEVADAAIGCGANLINDVSAGRDENMFKVVARHSVPIILMHMRGTPSNMTSCADYPEGQELECIASELRQNINTALKSGIYPWRIMTDPGIGFSKKIQHSISILQNLRKWPKLVGNYPTILGTSRKKFIGTVCNQPDPKQRMWGTSCTIAAAIQGGVNIVRVHDVIEMSQVVKMGDAIWKQIGYKSE